MKHVLNLLKAEMWRYEKSIQVLSVLVKATDDDGLRESLMRDQEYHDQFKRAYEILLTIKPNIESLNPNT